MDEELPCFEEIASGALKGVVITGSSTACYDTSKWTLTLKEWITKVSIGFPHVKILGACYGHQMIALALGGEAAAI